MDDYMNISRPGFHMTHGRSELILYTDQDKKESICCIANLEVIRGLEKSFEIDHSGFSLDANGTLRVSYFVLYGYHNAFILTKHLICLMFYRLIKGCLPIVSQSMQESFIA